MIDPEEHIPDVETENEDFEAVNNEKPDDPGDILEDFWGEKEQVKLNMGS